MTAVAPFESFQPSSETKEVKESRGSKERRGSSSKDRPRISSASKERRGSSGKLEHKRASSNVPSSNALAELSLQVAADAGQTLETKSRLTVTVNVGGGAAGASGNNSNSSNPSPRRPSIDRGGSRPGSSGPSRPGSGRRMSRDRRNSKDLRPRGVPCKIRLICK